MNRTLYLGFAVAAVFAAVVYWLFRPLSTEPIPADFHCYDTAQGAYVPLDLPQQVFGVGLTYAAHIQETASDYDPDAAPPVFEKSARSVVRTDAEVPFPSPDDLFAVADSLEPGLGEELRQRFPALSPLLDYEAEMGFVLLEDIDPSRLADQAFAPRLGFFIANDLSARSVAILGEGRPNRTAFWGASKSLSGFLPLAERAWVPEEPKPNGIPCVEIESRVNSEVRQQQSTADLIYTPKQMLTFIHGEFPENALSKGTVVLTGTPGGVAMVTPRWLARLSRAVRLSRFRILNAKLHGDRSRFLERGDRVTVRGQGLGKVSIAIVETPGR